MNSVGIRPVLAASLSVSFTLVLIIFIILATIMPSFKASTVSRFSKGQVLGPISVNKVILNSGGYKTEGVLDSPERVTALADSIKMSMLYLKGDYLVDNGRLVDYDGIRASAKYAEFKNLVCNLDGVDLCVLSNAARKAFLINIYNSLVIQALIEGQLSRFPGGTISRLYLYAKAAYTIGGYPFSLNEIENGLLRVNRLSAVPYTSLPFGDEDPRRNYMLTECDPRIHFALNCGAKSCPPIAVYSSEEQELNNQLQTATQGFLESNVRVDKESGKIFLSKLFQWYRQDFGSTDGEVIEWIRINSPTTVSSTISELLASGAKATISYDPYSWDLNSV